MLNNHEYLPMELYDDIVLTIKKYGENLEITTENSKKVYINKKNISEIIQI